RKGKQEHPPALKTKHSQAPSRAHYTPVPDSSSLSRNVRGLADLFLDRDGRHRVAHGDLEHDVHAIHDVAEQVIALRQLCAIVDRADEELASVRVRPRVGHRHRAGRVLTQNRLVSELVARSTAARTLRVAALDDKAGLN